MAHLSMRRREADRLEVIQAVPGNHSGQAGAALRLGLSDRQVKRLVRCHRPSGVTGLISGHRGKRPSTRSIRAFVTRPWP